MIDIRDLENIARQAGDEVRRIYEARSFVVSSKADASPVTEADLASNAMITNGLKRFGDVPYISEEEVDSHAVPQLIPKTYWLIDPLDGTKEFVLRRKAFTINIALISNEAPEVAVVFDPMENRMYSAYYGEYREDGVLKKIGTPWPEGKILVSSHSHPEHALHDFIQKNDITEHQRVGSSLKFCLVASGRAHVYPRFKPLKAWDTAAGDGVARASGCHVIAWSTGKAPLYAFDKAWTEPFYVLAPSSSIER